MNLLKKALNALSQLVFYSDPKCIMCNKDTGGSLLICDSCQKNIPLHKEGLCSICGRECGGGICGLCAADPRPYKAGAVVFKYMGPVRDIMLNLKLHGERINAKVFAAFMAGKFIEAGWPVPDAVTAVPSHILRVMNRGYNAPELIAKEFAVLIGAQYRKNIIIRNRFAPPMATMKNADRMEIVSHNYSAGKFDIESKTILIIDDITTTGSTLHVCSELLIRMGAKEVYVMAAAGD